MAAAHTGDRAAFESHLNRLVDIAAGSPSGPTAERGIAAMAAVMDAFATDDWSRTKVSESYAATILSAPRSTRLVEVIARISMGLIAARRSDRGTASEQYQRLLPYTGSHVLMITADRVLGRISEALGESDRALKHYLVAIDFTRRARYRPDLAWALYEYADLAAQVESEPHDKVALALDESLAIASQLGMKPLVERIVAKKGILKA